MWPRFLFAAGMAASPLLLACLASGKVVAAGSPALGASPSSGGAVARDSSRRGSIGSHRDAALCSIARARPFLRAGKPPRRERWNRFSGGRFAYAGLLCPARRLPLRMARASGGPAVRFRRHPAAGEEPPSSAGTRSRRTCHGRGCRGSRGYRPWCLSP